MSSFDYVKPDSLKNLVAGLNEAGSEGTVLAGGTDLLVRIKSGIVSYRVVFDLNDVNELKGIREDKNTLRIGAGTRIADIAGSDTVKRWAPFLSVAANELGSPQIRNRATVGGNILTASPAADTVPPLLAAGALLTLDGPGGERAVPLEDFMTGPGRTGIRGGEVLTGITVPKLPEGYTSQFIKVGRRRSLAISVINLAGWLKKDSSGAIEDVRLVLGAVAPTAIRAWEAEAYLKGKPPTRSVIEAAARLAAQEARPISDIRSTEEGRRSLVEGWAFRLLLFLTAQETAN